MESKTLNYSTECQVFLTHCTVSADGLLTIYGQPSDDESMKQIESMTSLINARVRNFEPVGDNLTIGDVYVAQFAEDGQWYRARTLQKVGNNWQVEFIDYGNFEIVKLSDLRHLPDQFRTCEPQVKSFILETDGMPLKEAALWTPLVIKSILADFQYAEIELNVCSLGSETIAKCQDIHNSLKEKSLIKLGLSYPFSSYPVGITFEAFVNCFDKGAVFLQARSSCKAVNSLMDNMEACYSDEEVSFRMRLPPEKVEVGTLVCTRNSVDGDFYRGQVLSVCGNSCDIFLIDYGNIERKRVDSLYQLCEEFRILEYQAIRCGISGLEITNEADSQRISELLLSFSTDKVFQVKVVDHGLVENMLNVVMHDIETGVSVIDHLTQAASSFLANDTMLARSQEFDAGTKLCDGINPSNKESNIQYSMISPHSMTGSPHIRDVDVPLGIQIPIRITCVEDPDCIWVQLLDCQADLIVLTGKMNDSYNRLSIAVNTLEKFEVGELCAVKTERNRNWCRCSIIGTLANSVEVKLVDYGYEETLPSADIKALTPEFARMPAQAVRCKLHDIKPSGSRWTTQSCRFIQEFVAKTGITAKFFASEGVGYTACMYISALDNMLLSEQMVNRGMAHWSSGNAGNQDIGNESNLFIASDQNFEFQTLPEADRVFYDHPGISLIGAEVAVKVCDATSPGDFFILPQNLESSETHQHLFVELKKSYDEASPPARNLYAGMPCIYLHKSNCYRAAVIENHKPMLPSIRLVDFGEKKTVSVNQLKKIMPRHITCLPPIVIRCTLHGVIEPVTQFWSSDSMKVFTEFVRENKRDLVCSIHGCISDRVCQYFMVKLFTPFKSIVTALTENSDCYISNPMGKTLPPFQLKSFVYSNHSVGIGKEDMFYITHIERTDLFYSQLASKFKDIDNLMDNVQAHCARSGLRKPVTMWELTYLPTCLVKHCDDKWYRAHYLSMSLTMRNLVNVIFVDYGNTTAVPLSNVIACDCDSGLVEPPIQAIPCCLSELSSPILDQAESNAVMQFLNNFLPNREFQGTITGRLNGRVYVDLFTAGKRVVDFLYGDVTGKHSPVLDQQCVGQHDSRLKEKFVAPSPIEPMSVHSAVICGISSPDDFHLRLESSEKHFNDCSKEVDDYYMAVRQHDYQVMWVQNGDVVCVKHHSTMKWCRALVIDDSSCAYNKAVVKFVDLGEKKTVAFENMKILMKNMLEWPTMAVKCRLAKVLPFQQFWSSEALHYFSHTCQNAQCRVRFKSYDMVLHEWTVDLKIQGLNVAHELVRNKHAKVIDSAPGTTVSVASTSIKTKKPDMLPTGSMHQVYISAVESCNDFYLQMVENVPSLEDLCCKIRSLEPTLKKIEALEAQKEHSYLARYDEDGQWYRARILKISQSNRETSFDVLFTDYGNCSQIKVGGLCLIPEELVSLPDQAINCCLLGEEGIDTEKLEEMATGDDPLTAEVIEYDAISAKTIVRFTQPECNTKHVRFSEVTAPCDIISADKNEDLCKFKELDIVCGIQTKIYISHVENCSKISIQPGAEEELSKLMVEMDTFYKKDTTTHMMQDHLLQAGAACVAKYSVDDGWYRAVIVTVEDDKNAAFVEFVDYGDEERVAKKDIRVIHPDFLELPKQAALCTLANVDLQKWTEDDTEKLLNEVADVELEATFNKIVNPNEACDVGLYEVELSFCDGTSLNDKWRTVLRERDSHAIGHHKGSGDGSTANEESNMLTISKKHVVSDRGDHVIVENLQLDTVSLDFDASLDNTSVSDNGSIMTRKGIQNLVIEEGTVEDGETSTIVSPAKFYIHLSRLQKGFDDVMASAKEDSKSDENFGEKIKPGEFCIAKTQHGDAWLRAKCLWVKHDMCQVFFVDFGHSETIPFHNVKYISEKTRAHPTYATLCTLSFSGSELKFNPYENDIFNQFVLGRLISVRFNKLLSSGAWFVTLKMGHIDILDKLNSSIIKGMKKNCYISYCVSPTEFYLQLSEFAPELDRIHELVIRDLKSGKELSHVFEKDFYLAKSPDDGQWYRAQCLSVQESSCEVLFVDYGNKSVVDRECLKYISEGTKSIATQAISCSIYAEKPVEEISEKQIDSFIDLTMNKELHVEFISRSVVGHWHVKLTVDNYDISQKLSFQKPAICSVEPDIYSNIFYDLQPGTMHCAKVAHVSGMDNFTAILQSSNSSLLKTFLKDMSTSLEAVNDINAGCFYVTTTAETMHCVKIVSVLKDKFTYVDLFSGICMEKSREQIVFYELQSQLKDFLSKSCIDCVLESSETLDLYDTLNDEFKKLVLGKYVVLTTISKISDLRWFVKLSLLGEDLTVDSLEHQMCENALISVPQITITHTEDKEDVSIVEGFQCDDIDQALQTDTNTQDWLAKNSSALLAYLSDGLNLLQDSPHTLSFLYETIKKVKLVVFVHRELSATSPKPYPASSLKDEPNKLENEKAVKVDANGNNIGKDSSDEKRLFIEEPFEAVAIRIEDPGLFYIRQTLLITADCKRSDGNEQTDTDVVLEHIPVGTTCLAKHFVEPFKLYHWIKIVIIDFKEDIYLVEDTDTKLQFSVTRDGLIVFSDKIQSWPSLCYKCFLSGVKPVANKNIWPCEVIEEFKSMMATSLTVCILSPTSKAAGSMETYEVSVIADGKSVADVMIKRGLACKIDGYKPRIDSEKENRMPHGTLIKSRVNILKKPFAEIPEIDLNFSVGSVDADDSCFCVSSTELPDFLAVPCSKIKNALKSVGDDSLLDSVFEDSRLSPLFTPYSAVEVSAPFIDESKPKKTFKIYCSTASVGQIENNSSLDCESPEKTIEPPDQNTPLSQYLRTVIQEDDVCTYIPASPLDPPTLPLEEDIRCSLEQVEISGSDITDQMADEKTAASRRDIRLFELAKEVVCNVYATVLHELEEESITPDSVLNITPEILQALEKGPLKEKGVSSYDIEISEKCDGSSNKITADIVLQDVQVQYLQESQGKETEEEITSHVSTEEVPLIEIPFPSSDNPYDEMRKKLMLEKCRSIAQATKYEDVQNETHSYDDNVLVYNSQQQSSHVILQDSKVTSTSGTLKENSTYIDDSLDAIPTPCLHRDYILVSSECTLQEPDHKEDCCTDTAENKNIEQQSELGYTPDTDKPEMEILAGESIYIEDSLGTPQTDLVGGKGTFLEPIAEQEECDTDLSQVEQNSDCFQEDNKSDDTSGSSGSTCDKNASTYIPCHDEGIGDASKADVLDIDTASTLENRYLLVKDSAVDSESSEGTTFTLEIPLISITDMDGESPVRVENIFADYLGCQLKDDACLAKHSEKKYICCLPDMHLEVGDTYPVTYIQSTSPIDIQLQFDLGKDSDDWRAGMCELNCEIDQLEESEPVHWEPDMLCLVQSMTDLAWYRGRFLECVQASTTDTAQTYSVEYIDFGFVTKVPADNLREMPDHLCVHVAQSVTCCLSNIRPATTTVNNPTEEQHTGQFWLAAVNEYLKDLLFCTPLKAKVVGLCREEEDEKAVVELYVSKDNEEDQDVSVMLVKEGLAGFVVYNEKNKNVENDNEKNTVEEGWSTITDSAWETVLNTDISSQTDLLHSSNIDLSNITDGSGHLPLLEGELDDVVVLDPANGIKKEYQNDDDDQVGGNLAADV